MRRWSGACFPLWYAVVASLSRDTELYQPHLFWGNCADMFGRSLLLRGMANALVIGLPAAIAVWNECPFAFTFTMTEEARKAPVTGSLLWGYMPHDQPWGRLMAACVLLTLPAPVAVFQRPMVVRLAV